MANFASQNPSQFFLWLFRSLGLIAVFAIPMAHFLVPEELNDPMWTRLVIAGFILAHVVGSFVSAWVRRHYRTVVHLTAIIITLYLNFLVFYNDLARATFFSYFLSLFGISLLFREVRIYLILYSTNLVLSLALLPLIDNPEMELTGFALGFGSSMLFGLAGLLMAHRETQSLETQESLLRIINAAAFRQSQAGIMVTSPDNKMLNYNEKLKQVWGITDDMILGNSIEKAIVVAQTRLKQPGHARAVANRIFEDPMLVIDDVIEMKNGRFYHRISEPLLHQEQLIGRIWFYHEITQLKREEAQLVETREQMYRQNEVMVHLASSNAINDGDLAIACQDITRAVATTLQTDGAEIWLFDDAEEVLVHRARYHLGRTAPDDPPLDTLVRVDHPALFSALQYTRVIDAVDMQVDPRTVSLVEAGEPRGASLIVPVRLQGKTVGMVRAYVQRKIDEWSVESQNFLASIGDFLAVVIESSERKATEFQLGKSLAILQAVFELSGLGILVTTLSGGVINYNRLYLELWGLDEEYMENSPATVIAFCQAQLRNSDQLRKSMAFLMENPDQDQFDFLEFNDGRLAERFTSVLEVEGTIIGRVWFFRDITDRIEAEKKLRESEQRNKAILNALPDLMLRLNMEGRILDFKTPESDVFPDLGLDLQDKSFLETFPRAFAEQALAQAEIAQKSGELQAFEIEMNLVGQDRDYEARIVPSSYYEVLLIIRDITERKRAEKELVQRNYELDSFVYRASHDLKAPLNSLMGLIDILRNETADGNVLMYLGLMDKSVVKLDTFIRNLTDFSRINRLQIKYTKVDFNQLVEEIAESLRYMENAQRVERSVTVHPGKPLFADGFHIGIVLSNLISNAIKYQDHAKDRSQVDIAVTVDDKEAVITVTDNGVGIPKEYQDRIFELFFRATNQSFGSGLGLYITRNAVEKMDGTISFESEPGEGTQFTIVIPNQLENILTAGHSDN
ncbi:MAG: ATP-binding protein [Bacteroidota bacterium]